MEKLNDCDDRDYCGLFMDWAANPEYSLEARIWETKQYAQSGEPSSKAELESLKIEHREADKINDEKTIIMVGTALNVRMTSLLAMADTEAKQDKAVCENWFDKSIN